LCAVDNAYFVPLFEANDDLNIEASEIKKNLELGNDVATNEAKSTGWKNN